MCGTEVSARRALERVFELAGESASGWWVLNTTAVHVPNGNTDLDLLVGIPNTGLLIVEVKGWTAFDVNDEGKWSFERRPGKFESAGTGPYAQAERCEYLLLDLLDLLRGSKDLPMGDLPKIGSAVLFGRLHSSTTALPVLNRQRTLFRDTFCPSDMTEQQALKILSRLRAKLQEQFSPNRRTDNGVARLHNVYDCLRPLCSVRCGLAAFADESQIRIDALTEVAFEERASMYSGTRLYVEGAAGTGKTVLALKLAVERARLSGRPAIYVCYSTLLAQEVRQTPWIQQENVIIGTPEDLLESVGRSDLVEAAVDNETQALFAAQNAAALLGLPVPVGRPRAYLDDPVFVEGLVRAMADAEIDSAAVVIDESQDFSDSMIEGLSTLAGPNDLVGVFVDPRQTTRRERALQAWKRPLCVDGGDVFTLTRNYRNGDRIIDVVESEFNIGYERPPRGASPAEVRIERYRSAKELPELVNGVVRSLKEDGLDPTVIVTGVQAAELTALVELGTNPQDVDAFKGLERRCVVLVQGAASNPLDPNREDVYVGLTRATTVLFVVRQER